MEVIVFLNKINIGTHLLGHLVNFDPKLDNGDTYAELALALMDGEIVRFGDLDLIA